MNSNDTQVTSVLTDTAVDTATAQAFPGNDVTVAQATNADLAVLPAHPGHRVLDEIEAKSNEMGSYVVSSLSALISQLRALL